ncbi:hypothetical protein DFQ30_001206 [Apophysomyces sp. BC1015]|nr:hypothetical protein DFQ30_001206 [Apophysomyces sp. BC1015]
MDGGQLDGKSLTCTIAASRRLPTPSPPPSERRRYVLMHPLDVAVGQIPTLEPEDVILDPDHLLDVVVEDEIRIRAVDHHPPIVVEDVFRILAVDHPVTPEAEVMTATPVAEVYHPCVVVAASQGIKSHAQMDEMGEGLCMG